MNKDKLFLLPYDQYCLSQEVSYRGGADFNTLIGAQYSAFESGKAVIHHLMRFYGLGRDDEVMISTTSGSAFVSSCVTCTLFNYAKLSRVLTDKTRLIFVIHEFGYPNREIDSLLRISRERSIPLIEDVAHAFDSMYEGTRLGSLGDASLHSLPKTFPVTDGGILVSSDKSLHYLGSDQVVESKLRQFSTSLTELGDVKRSIVHHYQSGLVSFKPVFDYDEGVTPFVYGFLSDKYERINASLEAHGCQVGRTYNPGWVLLPINPYSTRSQRQFYIDMINDIAGS